MIKILKKKNLVTVFAFIMVATILMTPLATHAAFTQQATVAANGVRLRKKPVDGTILELMYKGESILIDNDVYDPDYAAWLYVKRVKTGTIGWMEWSYFEHQ